MRIIVLQGMPNTGKTSTLNLVYNMLVPNGGGVSTNRQALGGDPNDFSDIVLRGNQRISFFTMGDYSTHLSNAVYNYLAQGCDILFCALSVNTTKQIANNTLNRHNATRINKASSTNLVTEQQANAADAQALFNLI